MIRVFIFLFILSVAAYGQKKVTVDNSTGALIDPAAATFKSANGIPSSTGTISHSLTSGSAALSGSSATSGTSAFSLTSSTATYSLTSGTATNALNLGGVDASGYVQKTGANVLTGSYDFSGGTVTLPSGITINQPSIVGGLLTSSTLAGLTQLTGTINFSGGAVNGVVPLAGGGSTVLQSGTMATTASVDAITPSSTGLYLMTTFISGEDKLRMMVSSDLTTWSPIGGTLFTPGSGGLRDPSFLERNGTYYIVYTAGSFGNVNYAKIISSTDLVTWTDYGTISTASVGSISFTWPNAWFEDGGDTYVIVSISTDGGTTMKPYCVKANGNDLTSWGNPVEITGTSFPSQVIGLHIIKQGSTYYFWYKDDVADKNRYATSSSPFSGYTIGSDPGWGSPYEGVSFINTSGSNWHALGIDQYTNQGLYYSTSTTGLGGTWSALSKMKVTGAYAGSNPYCFQVTTSKLAKDTYDALARFSSKTRYDNGVTAPTLWYNRYASWPSGKIGYGSSETLNYEASDIFVNCYIDANGTYKGIDTSKPSWLLETGYGSSLDSFALYRASASAGDLSFSNLLTLTSAGSLRVPSIITPAITGTTGTFPTLVTTTATAGTMVVTGSSSVNGTNYLYKTTGANYERLTMGVSGSVFYMAPEKGGSGSLRQVDYAGAPLTFTYSGVGEVMNFNSSRDAKATAGDFVTDTVGKTLKVKSGANSLAGTFTLTSGAATITSTAIDVNTVIVSSLKTLSGTAGTAPPLATVTSGTATISGAVTDNSTYNWIGMKVN